MRLTLGVSSLFRTRRGRTRAPSAAASGYPTWVQTSSASETQKSTTSTVTAVSLRPPADRAVASDWCQVLHSDKSPQISTCQRLCQVREKALAPLAGALEAPLASGDRSPPP